MSERLNQRLISNLKAPAKGNTITYDGEVRGFGVRITSAGAISFILNYRIHGRERRYTIGRYPEWSLAAAREEAVRLRSAIAQGSDPLGEREQEREAPTVKDLADDYLERHARPYKRARSVYEDELMLDRFIRPRIGQLQVEAITRRDIEELHQMLKGTPYYANRVLALVSKMFRLAVQWGFCKENPAVGIPKFHEEKRERWLNEKELKAVFKALAKHKNQTAANAIRLLVVTGSRKAEVLSAKWEQFDLKRGVWTKPSHHTKQKKTEHVPLNDQARALLKQIKREGEFLFPGGHDGHLEDVRGVWADVCTTAKLKGVRIHDLRHSFASHLVSSGVPLAIVGRLLGHTQPQTTARYAHIADSPLREAANKFVAVVKP